MDNERSAELAIRWAQAQTPEARDAVREDLLEHLDVLTGYAEFDDMWADVAELDTWLRDHGLSDDPLEGLAA